MNEFSVINTTVIEAVTYPQTNEGFQVNCNVVVRNGKFLAVEFQTIDYGGYPFQASFTVDSKGVHTEYHGEKEGELKALLTEFQDALAEKYSFEWENEEEEIIDDGYIETEEE